MTPFTRKYLKLIDGTLNQFEEEEKEKFANYIMNIENEAIEGGNDEWNVLKFNPVVFEMSPFFSLDLGNISRISFSVADDPFYKSLRSRYYPEVLVMNMKGAIKGRVNPFTRGYKRHGVDTLMYEEDFREPQLKINDDKRVHINLNNLIPKTKVAEKSVDKKSMAGSHTSLGHKAPSGKMILLTVRISEEAFKGKEPI